MNHPLARNLACLAALAIPAAHAQAIHAYALTQHGYLLSFDTDAPSDLLGAEFIQTRPSGYTIPLDLIDIALRPSNGGLYGVGRLGGLFRLDGGANLPEPGSPYVRIGPPTGSRFGIDFDPLNDGLRQVSDLDANQNSAIVPADAYYPLPHYGPATNDGTLHYGPGQPGATGVNPGVTAIAYSNAFVGATSTTLYGIDVRGDTDRLVKINPTSGEMMVVGLIGLDATAVNGFDIYHDGTTNLAFAALQGTNSGTSSLYSIDLATGHATRLGEIGDGDTIDGLAVGRAAVPEPASLAVFGLCLAALRRRRR